MNKEKDLGTSLIETLGKSELGKIVPDYLDIGLDSQLAEGIFRELPIVRSMLAIYKTSLNIRDLILLKKIILFIKEVNNINEKERQKFLNKMSENKNYQRRVGEQLLLYLDRLDEIEKAPLLAKIFGEYIEGTIDQQQMKRLASGLDRALLADIIALKKFMIDKQPLARENFYGLEGVGLATTYHSITHPLEPEDVTGQIDELHFVISPTAVQLIKVCFDKT